MKFDFIFVVLVYRNTNDLNDFFKSLNIPNSKVIVVNSYYDDTTMNEFQEIAQKNNADFLNFPNKGYGFGNNRGCEYALKNYDFRFLIISNADIYINYLDINILSENCITAPQIKNLKGKNQNPNLPYFIKFMEKIKYNLLKNNSKYLINICWLYSRITREIYLLFHKKGRIFSAHGSFVIFPKNILEKLFPIYDEKMFLFTEELHLGMKAQKLKINTFYNSNIKIKHKEDGSISFLKNIESYEKDSYLIFYENWIKKSNKQNNN